MARHDRVLKTGTDVYRAKCSCGWKGEKRLARGTADADYSRHRSKVMPPGQRYA